MIDTLNNCLSVANTISANSADRGMASIKLWYDPYLSDWHASANWSDSSEITAGDSTPEASLKQLQTKLYNHLAEIRATFKEQKRAID